MQNKEARLYVAQAAEGAPPPAAAGGGGGGGGGGMAQFFAGLVFFVNGDVEPPLNELNRLIYRHGGTRQHYLRLEEVTHIVASQLRDAQIEEILGARGTRRAVVEPRWVVDCVGVRVQFRDCIRVEHAVFDGLFN